MRVSATRRKRSAAASSTTRTIVRPSPRPSPRTAGRTAGRTGMVLFTTAAVLSSAGCFGSSDDPSRHGPTRAGKTPGAKRSIVWNTRPTSIASLGDSITRGFDACSVLSDCPEVSWSTGTDVRSLAQRLLPSATADAGTHAWNFAKTGAVVADLPGQIEAAAARKPKLITVMIGANDACRDSVDDMTSAEQFRTTFTSALTRLRRDLPKTQVYVASVPDLKRLWSEGRKNVFGRQIWKLGICPSMLKDSQDLDAASNDRRQRVADRVTEYNKVLKDVCGRDVLCRFDPAVHEYRFTTHELSKWDWFHPSKAGQAQLANMAYRRITAP
ncbi:SGNH/GDSL hydrolase family protein [Streptomyces sp. DASNCL29]|uniref:SGNH/GDSL hydrolase family protein n=1 Tax=Streptomyces sp. DASNCL29 TaxID=2583819 RepID=UPI00110FF326|nr:SGNH/GDSL hydrolase family protein [Streptomyces sp. DASNCL29]TMU94876.1 SGNH/GDSL hydrolase family protein [Streptomyces sp. DASNCL29]